jgi:glutaredoxin
VSRVVLFTRPGCHLCDVARTVVAGVAAELDVPYDEVDIRTSPELLLEHGARVPVVEVDGRELAHFRVGADALRAALARGPSDAS